MSINSDNTGALIREYAYLNGEPLAQIDAGGSETLIYLHTDHLMTPRYATNTGGSTVWTWDSGAFGAEAPTGSATVNLRFPGQYYDGETSLHYNWNRYYAPATGRYISSDPMGLEAGLNTYAYAALNPMILLDPLGLEVRVSVSAVVDLSTFKISCLNGGFLCLNLRDAHWGDRYFLLFAVRASIQALLKIKCTETECPEKPWGAELKTTIQVDAQQKISVPLCPIVEGLGLLGKLSRGKIQVIEAACSGYVVGTMAAFYDFQISKIREDLEQLRSPLLENVLEYALEWCKKHNPFKGSDD